MAGLYGHPVPLETDHGIEVVTADDHYLHDSILLPQKQIVASYGPPSVMPTYEGQIGEEEVFQLIQYIKSLRRRRAGRSTLRQNQQVPADKPRSIEPKTQNRPPNPKLGHGRLPDRRVSGPTAAGERPAHSGVQSAADFLLTLS